MSGFNLGEGRFRCIRISDIPGLVPYGSYQTPKVLCRRALYPEVFDGRGYNTIRADLRLTREPVEVLPDFYLGVQESPEEIALLWGQELMPGCSPDHS